MLKVIIWILVLSMVWTGALAQDATSYAERFFEGSEDQALYDLFTDEAKAQIPFEAFDTIKEQLIAAYGPLQTITDAQSAPFGDQTIMTQYIILENKVLLMQLITNKDGMVAGLGFVPQEEKTAIQEKQSVLPEGVVESEIAVGEGEWALPGLLTIQENANNVPLVVLVHGSGPNDKDESVGQTKLFRDLAHILAQNGIATIRYDKRTLVHGARMDTKTFTIKEETIEDALLAAQLAKKLPEVDPTRIFLLGHSLGGMVAPRIALEAEGLFRGMILLAGSPKSLVDIVVAQNKAVIGKMPADAQSGQLGMLDKEIARMNDIFAMPEEKIQGETIFMTPAYYLYEMQTVDPIETIKALGIPTLIMQGEGDFQVTVENGLGAYQEVLGDQTRITYRLYPGLNHCFTASIETQTVQDYEKPLHLDDSAANDIIAFIQAN